MHAFVRFRRTEIDGARALRRVVRAGPSHRRGDGAVLRRSISRDAVVDPDARSFRALGRRASRLHPRRASLRGAERRRARGFVADLLRRHLQPGARQSRRHAPGDAGEAVGDTAGNHGIAGNCSLTRPRACRPCSPARPRVRVHGRSCPRRRVSTHCERPPRAAKDASCTSTRRRPCSAKGPRRARIMLVGEQPGDQEDLQGSPFVGPAGEVLESRAGGGRARPRRRLHDQRGQALQVGAARQAPHSPEAAHHRDSRVPSVARSRRSRPCSRPSSSVSELHGRAVADGPAVPNHQEPRTSAAVAVGHRRSSPRSIRQRCFAPTRRPRAMRCSRR